MTNWSPKPGAVHQRKKKQEKNNLSINIGAGRVDWLAAGLINSNGD